MVIEFAAATVSYFGDDEALLPAALSDIDLLIPSGQCVLVTGDSGCGKTTLLRCLNGLVPHFFDAHVTGSITLDGVPVAQLEARDLASRCRAMRTASLRRRKRWTGRRNAALGHGRRSSVPAISIAQVCET